MSSNYVNPPAKNAVRTGALRTWTFNLWGQMGFPPPPLWLSRNETCSPVQTS